MVPKIEEPTRFLRRLNVAESGCWEYAGSINENGYGLYYEHAPEGRTKTVTAHRFSYRLHKGAIPSGMCVCHSCDNRKCCNPDHLFLGTNADNSRDMVRKGRSHKGKKPAHAIVRGERHGFAKLTDAKVQEIHRLRAGGLTGVEIADRLGMGRTAIYCVLRGDTWQHLHPELSQAITES